MEADERTTVGEGRLLPLDALRGVAISLVIVHHVGFRFPTAPRGMVGDFIAAIGWAGVDLFFAISGYLITTILMRSSEDGALRQFYIRRAYRIIPLYLAALLLFMVASVLTGNDREVIGRLWINALFLTAWFIPFLGENGVPYTITWSVSVEEFSYLLFGLVSLLGARKFRWSLYWVVLAALVLRSSAIFLFAFDPETMYYFAPGRIDAIAAGGIAATVGPSVVRRLAVTPWVPALTWMVVVGMLAWLHRGNPLVATAGYTVLAVASAWLVLNVALLQSRKYSLLTKWLAKLGLVSYFVYLFHGFALAALFRVLPLQWGDLLTVWGLAAATLLLTYVPARLSWRFFEHPLILIGRRTGAREDAN